MSTRSPGTPHETSNMSMDGPLTVSSGDLSPNLVILTLLSIAMLPLHGKTEVRSASFGIEKLKSSTNCFSETVQRSIDSRLLVPLFCCVPLVDWILNIAAMNALCLCLASTLCIDP